MRWPWTKQPAPTPEPVVLLPPTNTEKVPDWERITLSEIWQEELYPMYYALRQSALEELMKAKTMDEFRLLQGKAIALDAILKIPAQMVAMETFRKQQEAQVEESEDGPRGRGIGERFSRPARV